MAVGPDKEATHGFYVDPGTHKAGLVGLEGRELKRAAVVRRPSDAPSGPKEARKWAMLLADDIIWQIAEWLKGEDDPRVRIVVEFQQIYTKGRARTKNPKDILVLTLQAGAVIMGLKQRGIHLTSWDLREPAVWKQNVNEQILKRRTRLKLSQEELAVFGTLGRSKDNPDVWVAAGIALHDVGRRDK